MEPESTFRRKTMRVKWMLAGLLAAGVVWAVPRATTAQQWIVPEKSPKPTGPYPIYMPSAQPSAPAATASVATESGFRAARFTGDEKADTARLNELVADGWEYVGPLANGTVAYKRALRPNPELENLKAQLGLQGVWEANGETLTLIGDRWSWHKTGVEPTDVNTFRVVEVTRKWIAVDLKMNALGWRSGETAKCIFKRDGDTLYYCGTYDRPRPTAFVKDQGDPCYVAWKRVKNPVAAPTVSDLEGTWTQVSHQAGDAPVFPAADEPPTFIVAGNKWAYKSAGGGVLQAGTFTLDETTSPKHFTFTVTEGGNVGGVGYAIYKLDGDTFVYYACDAGPDARPTDFTTKPGDGRYMLTWKRAKK